MVLVLNVTEVLLSAMESLLAPPSREDELKAAAVAIVSLPLPPRMVPPV